MDTEKLLTIVALVVAGLLTLAFALDLVIKIPFGGSQPVLNILFIVAGAFVIWQSLETYREFA